MALGFLLACSAMHVRAEPKAPVATPPVSPAARQPSAPVDLALHPAAAPGAIDLAVHPETLSVPSGAIDPALHAVAAPPQSGAIDMSLQSASDEVRRVAGWVVASRDNAGLPYLLIDKVNAQVFVFNRTGQLRGVAPALLGLARGDRLLAPNSATMAQMPPQVRITPAGRFVSRLAIDSLGKELLVLDYDASISLHAVVKGTPEERRAERLNSATAEDNRISYGCINVPTKFYATVVSPTFARTKGVVYVLPETSPASAMFGLPPADTAVAGARASSSVQDARTAQTVSASGAK